MQITHNVINQRALDKLRELQNEGEPDIVQEFIEIYLSQTPALLTRLRAALSNKNLEDVHRAAHTIRGSSYFVGADSVVVLSAEIEERSGSGQFGGVEDLVQRVEKEFEIVKSLFKELGQLQCA